MNSFPQRYSQSLEDGAMNYDLLVTDAESSHWLVLVHGINRDVDGLLRWFGEVAQLSGYNLIAPIFDSVQYQDYQRLGREGLGRRADHALLSVLDDLGGLGFRLPEQIPMFGFSGGAQFAHRFALAYGERLSALICDSAGWYTPLDDDERYPYGLAATARLQALDFKAERLLNLPTLTLVGEADHSLDASVRNHPKVNPVQGKTRFDRALWWHQHLEDNASTESTHVLQIMPGCGHNFHQCALNGELATRVFAFCRLVRRMRFDPTLETLP